MNNFRVYQQQQRLHNAFKLAKNLPREPEVLSHYSRYLCVLSSGFIETSVRTIFADYARHTAVNTSDYVVGQLERFQNPKAETIAQLVGSFEKSWESTFRAEIEGAPADSLNSIVDNRNKIAHGENVGISYHTIEGYLRNATKVIELIDEKFRI